MRWFLSYHSPDQALAERLKGAIERNHSDSRVFFAPTSLRAGGAWTAQLAQEIAEADIFIFLVGEAGVGSWQIPEYDEALDRWVKSGRTFPLIVILLEGQKAPGLPFLRQLHWIVTADPVSEKDLGRLFDAASGQGSQLDELWRFTSPYRGLEAMEEKDSDYFFGRCRETGEALDALAMSDRLPVLIGNSGVGKSSLALAGVLAALKRQAWPEQARHPWPEIFQDSRQWCYLSLRPGTEPIKALVGAFVETWQFAATDPERSDHQHGWIERLRDGKATLSDLIEATERRRVELKQAKPPAFFLYVDQGEELYVRAEEGQRRCFSQLLVEGLSDPRLRTMMSMRSDFLGDLQKDEPLFRARQQIDVPPLREEALREVVSRPAQMLGARFEPENLIDIITSRTVEDSVNDVGALPLLSYTLDDMWREMTRQSDGRLRLPAQSFELGGVLVSRANRFLAEHRDAEDDLRRVFTLRLATTREDGEPTRRQARRGEFSNAEWRLVSDLADYPNRLLVIATTESGDIYAEVAHEAIFRRWDRLREWIAAEREFLAWRSGLEAARRAWQATNDRTKKDAVLTGLALAQARKWIETRFQDIPETDREFILQSSKLSRTGGLLPIFATIAAGLALFVVPLPGISFSTNFEINRAWQVYLIVGFYIAFLVNYYINQICGHTKPDWMLALVSLLTLVLLLTAVWHYWYILFYNVIPAAQWQNSAYAIVRMAGWWFGTGLCEEGFKALPLGGLCLAGVGLGYAARRSTGKFKAYLDGVRNLVGLNEPIDGIVLGAASGSSFFIAETLTQYVPQIMGTAKYPGSQAFQGLVLLIARGLSGGTEHAAWAALFGYFIGLAMLHPRKAYFLIPLGWLSAAALHGGWDAIGTFTNSDILILLFLAFDGLLTYVLLIRAIFNARDISLRVVLAAKAAAQA